jgi:SOS-response transcriptional repressor LexA
MTTSTQPPDDDDRNHRLAERQQSILDFIHESMAGRAYPPSMREIADAVGLRSTSAVSYQLNLLAEMGYLARDANKARTVVEKPRRLRVIREGNGSQNMVCVPATFG